MPPIPAYIDDALGPEEGEMLGHARLRQVQALAEAGNVLLVQTQLLDDAEAVRVSQRSQPATELPGCQ